MIFIMLKNFNKEFPGVYKTSKWRWYKCKGNTKEENGYLINLDIKI